METTILKGTDISTTRLGFGCARLMRDGSAKSRRITLESALDAGIRHFDVARMYGLGAAEGELGKFAQGRRDKLIIATKFGIDINPTARRAASIQSLARKILAAFPSLRKFVRRSGGALVQPKDFSASKAKASLETSLRELGTDYIDIFFLHEPVLSEVTGTDVLEFLDKAKDSGMIRAYGISGDFSDIQSISSAMPALAPVIQFPNDISLSNTETGEFNSDLAALTYSPFSNVLQPILEFIKNDKNRQAKWSELTGADCTTSNNLAPLLLRYCLNALPGGVVLFSTSRPDRLLNLVERTNSDEITNSNITNFMKLVKSEVLPQNTDISSNQSSS